MDKKELPAAAEPETTTPETTPSEKTERFTSRLLSAVRDAEDKAKKGPGGDPEPVTPEKKESENPEATSKSEDEPEKKSDPAPEADPDENVESDIKKNTANMTPAHKAAFTKLRYSERDLRRKLAAAERENADLKASPTAPAVETSEEAVRLKQDLEEARAKLAEYDGEIKVSRLEATDEFKRQVTAPRTEIGKTAQTLVERYKLNEDTVVRAFHTSDSEVVASLTADMNEFDRYQFYSLVNKFREVDQVEASLRENAAGELDRISKTRREQAELESRSRKEEWDKAVPEVWKSLQEEFPVLEPIEGDEEWNKLVKEVQDYASPAQYGNLTTREQVEVLYRARAFPVLTEELDQTQAELVRVSAELEKYEKSDPDLSSASEGKSKGTDPDDGKLSLSQKIASRLQREGLSR